MAIHVCSLHYHSGKQNIFTPSTSPIQKQCSPYKDLEVFLPLVGAIGCPFLVPSVEQFGHLHHASQDWHHNEATTSNKRKLGQILTSFNKEVPSQCWVYQSKQHSVKKMISGPY